MVADGGDAEEDALARLEVHDRLASALFGEQVVGGDEEAAAGIAGDQVAGAVLPDEEGGNVFVLRHFGDEADGLAVAAAAREVAGAERVGAGRRWR